MSRPQSEFHRPEAPWRRPPGSPDGVWEQVLAEDPDSEDATVLQRYEPETDTSAQGPVRHDFFEEVYVVEGSLTDLRLGETFTAGMYAYRHPGMEHGPWTSTEGVLMLVRRGRP
ncbi:MULTISPECIES: cupin domain-containing protein [unclassified Streptomyces]|uniref:cupin domain-containing protein n=1 Tax=unclassified Streptomyces TaxID=2593676 RepID=UPI0022562992|nr:MULTISPECIES: cupin domain-containing protein [unclassified Streptomyces]MCX4878817.1 cupin domain-containing protein [Streptomyces sp. NBC_00847]MCX5418781.1 cupin domain-containing protein [Streptomyces sp. NBC_00078]